MPLIAIRSSFDSAVAPGCVMKVYTPASTIALLVLAGVYTFITQPDAPAESKDLGIAMSGIDPFNLSMASVPSLSNEYNGISTTTPYLEDGASVRFRNYHVNFEPLSQTVGCEQGAYQDLGILGYTLMGGVPTAVTLVSERVCGTGYFPHIVLYQAAGECKERLVGCAGDTKIAGVVALEGDRIQIRSLNIKPNRMSLTYFSYGESESTTVNLEYADGMLTKK